MTTIPNLPLPDELASVREQIRNLEERETAIRQALLSDPSARTGNAYVADVREVETTSTDLAELRKMHAELVAEYTFPKRVTRIVLSAITDDGEIVGMRRAPKLKTLRIV